MGESGTFHTLVKQQVNLQKTSTTIAEATDNRATQADAAWHVAVITPGFPADEQDTTCIPALQDWVYAQARSGHTALTIISLHYPFTRGYYEWYGVPVYALAGANSGFPGRLGTWYQLWGLLRSLQPLSGLHACWYTEAAWLASWMGWLLQLPVRTTLMGKELQERNWYKPFIRKHAVIAVSERQAADAHQAGVPVQEIIPWGLNSSLAAPEPNRTLDLIGVGNLTANKQFDVLVRLAAALVPDFPQLRVALIGDGAQKPNLRKLVEQLGISAHVTFYGHCSRTVVHEAMAQARVLVHPARYEAFGLVYLEALAYGLGIASFTTGIAQSSKQWWVASDEKSLAKGTAKLLQEAPFPPARSYSVSHTVACYSGIYQRFTPVRAHQNLA